jgi:hypothetical protein
VAAGVPVVPNDTLPGSGKSYVSDANVEIVKKTADILSARAQPFAKIQTAPCNGACVSPIFTGDELRVIVAWFASIESAAAEAADLRAEESSVLSP